MGRHLQPIPAGKPTTVVRNIGARQKRLSRLRGLLLQGAPIALIRETMKKEFAIGKDTVEDDVKLLRVELEESFKEERTHMVETTVAQLQTIAAELKQVAQDAKERDESSVRVAAYNGARQALLDAAKVAGILIEKQQVAGTIVHAVAPMTHAEAVAAFVRSLEHAHLSSEEAAALIETPAGRVS